MTHWLVLPSPFLGAAVYAPLVDALRLDGDGASMASVPGTPSVARLIEEWAVAAAGYADVVLVPHSNAGNLAPLVSDRCGGLPMVFMDAALPTPSGASPLVPARLRSHLATLADADGTLPVWTRWWPREELDEVLPGDWFDRVDANAPRVPLAYVDDVVEAPAGWEQGRCAYLAFGAETYAEELTRVRALGWPRRVVAGRHLHCLVDPGATTHALRSLMDEIRGSGSRPAREPRPPGG